MVAASGNSEHPPSLGACIHVYYTHTNLIAQSGTASRDHKQVICIQGLQNLAAQPKPPGAGCEGPSLHDRELAMPVGAKRLNTALCVSPLLLLFHTSSSTYHHPRACVHLPATGWLPPVVVVRASQLCDVTFANTYGMRQWIALNMSDSML